MVRGGGERGGGRGLRIPGSGSGEEGRGRGEGGGQSLALKFDRQGHRRRQAGRGA